MVNLAFILCFLSILFCCFNILIKPRRVLYDIGLTLPQSKTMKFDIESQPFLNFRLIFDSISSILFFEQPYCLFDKRPKNFIARFCGSISSFWEKIIKHFSRHFLRVGCAINQKIDYLLNRFIRLFNCFHKTTTFFVMLFGVVYIVLL